ncbi:DUF7576 family protein [Haladaptatus caseinilyticus]|uniref:DUF7576 family protein n=1 Tax=Haladaptatus caseinilyticus TaxID=2993314 RepID=UPI00224B04B2|nr:hypothetical protein [Haladaptatus caseinilyticus]
MPNTGHSDDEFPPCANCGKLVDIADHHPSVVVRYGGTANDIERTTLHFCSDDCLDEWSGPIPD